MPCGPPRTPSTAIYLLQGSALPACAPRAMPRSSQLTIPLSPQHHRRWHRRRLCPPRSLGLTLDPSPSSTPCSAASDLVRCRPKAHVHNCSFCRFYTVNISLLLFNQRSKLPLGIDACIVTAHRKKGKLCIMCVVEK